jgi:arsenate reductase
MVPDGSDRDGVGGAGGIRGDRHRLLGPRRNERPSPPPVRQSPQDRSAAPHASAKQPAFGKKRVLFVCIGNSCRSQMAEAFARAYGSDTMETRSAGVSPATIIAPLTRQVLAERNLQIGGHFPKGLDLVMKEPWDLIVNMSGVPLGLKGARVIEWQVPDPIGQKDSVYRDVATQIEGLVMRLILDLRARRQ